MKKVTYRDIIDRYGAERQSRQAMEELAELIQAINKALRFPNDELKRLDVIEEIADVIIMINQVCVIHDIKAKEVKAVARYKKKRIARECLKESER